MDNYRNVVGVINKINYNVKRSIECYNKEFIVIKNLKLIIMLNIV